MMIDRRLFLQTTGLAVAGAAASRVYSFPLIIRPKSIIAPVEISDDLLAQINAVTIRDLWPRPFEKYYVNPHLLGVYMSVHHEDGTVWAKVIDYAKQRESRAVRREAADL